MLLYLFSLVVLAGCVMWGFTWLIYAVAAFIISTFVGFWVEAEMKRADEAARRYVHSQGVEPGRTVDALAAFMRNATRFAGTFFPVVTMISICVAIACRVRTRQISRPPACVPLRPGFTAPGRLVLR